MSTSAPKGTAHLDDLLRHEEEPPAVAPRRAGHAGLAWLGRTALVSAGLAGVLVLGMRAAGIGAPFPLAFMVILALLTLRQLVRLVAVPPPSRASVRRPVSLPDEGGYNWGNVDGLRAATNRWENRLDWCEGEPVRFARTVQPRLAEIVDERLRQRHGFTRATDPARARPLLGDPLWTFLESPVGKPLTPREFAGVIAALEAL
jgi:hypothetical protein